jgi:hypothetical protein
MSGKPLRLATACSGRHDAEGADRSNPDRCAPATHVGLTTVIGSRRAPMGPVRAKNSFLQSSVAAAPFGVWPFAFGDDFGPSTRARAREGRNLLRLCPRSDSLAPITEVMGGGPSDG